MKSPRGTSGRRKRVRSGCLFFCLGHCWLGDQQSPPFSRWLSLGSCLLCVPGALPAVHPQAFLLNSSHFLALCLCSNSTSLLYHEHGFSKIVFFFNFPQIFQFEYVNFLSIRIGWSRLSLSSWGPLRGPLLSPVLLFSVTSCLIVNPS